jgi:hypothetical protein
LVPTTEKVAEKEATDETRVNADEKNALKDVGSGYVTPNQEIKRRILSTESTEGHGNGRLGGMRSCEWPVTPMTNADDPPIFPFPCPSVPFRGQSSSMPAWISQQPSTNANTLEQKGTKETKNTGAVITLAASTRGG